MNNKDAVRRKWGHIVVAFETTLRFLFQVPGEAVEEFKIRVRKGDLPLQSSL